MGVVMDEESGRCGYHDILEGKSYGRGCFEAEMGVMVMMDLLRSKLSS